MFGDGVYEVTEVYKGKCFALKLHLERLSRSLRELRIPPPYPEEELVRFHHRLIQESGIQSGWIYLQITRGWAPRSHAFPEKVTPRLSMMIRPLAPLPAGLAFRWQIARQPGQETLNLLGNVLAIQKAKEAGGFEALFVRDGRITECAMSNFFAVKDGTLWTHPANNFILRGISRTIILNFLVGPLGIPVREESFDVVFLKKADEAFLSSTGENIIPVVRVDDWPVAAGKPGPITRRLIGAFLAYREKECS
ncbi:MAG: aminotransferase class IV [Deltaproteobacteria bacterium]|nr:aminotransferase class IV [Deltaproteobacteria bacterium]